MGRHDSWVVIILSTFQNDWVDIKWSKYPKYSTYMSWLTFANVGGFNRWTIFPNQCGKKISLACFPLQVTTPSAIGELIIGLGTSESFRCIFGHSPPENATNKGYNYPWFCSTGSLLIKVLGDFYRPGLFFSNTAALVGFCWCWAKAATVNKVCPQYNPCSDIVPWKNRGHEEVGQLCQLINDSWYTSKAVKLTALAINGCKYILFFGEQCVVWQHFFSEEPIRPVNKCCTNTRHLE